MTFENSAISELVTLIVVSAIIDIYTQFAAFYCKLVTGNFETS